MTQVLVHERPQVVRADWLTEPPREWERRLREISPITDRVSHLRFRWRRDEDAEGGGQWALYECVPAAMLTPDRVTQLSVHWTALPTAQQFGRKASVSEYQFYMFREHRVSVSLFWCLQGTQFITGGTPFRFTEREAKLLSASGASDETIPPGTLPNIPFDERVVAAILARDRLLEAGGNLDALERASATGALATEDEETERLYRKTFLDWNNTNNAASRDFLSWYYRQKESHDVLPPAPKHLANALSDFRDKYIETGSLGGGVAASRLLIPVG